MRSGRTSLLRREQCLRARQQRLSLTAPQCWAVRQPLPCVGTEEPVPQRHTLSGRDSPRLPGPADGLQSDAVIVEERQSPSHGCAFSVDDRDPVQGHGPRSCPTSMKGHSVLVEASVVVWSQPVPHLGTFSGCSDGSTDRFYFSHRLNARESPSCHTASMEPNTDTPSNPGLSVRPLHLNTLFFMSPPKFLNLTTAPTCNSRTTLPWRSPELLCPS